MANLKFGCFGDDFTGASDAASFIKKAGLKTILLNNVPAEDFVIPEDTEAVVIALKIRTIPVAEAVDAALKACDWLLKQGAHHLYYKYCSTFDSTDEGNIGPITDAIMEKYNLSSTILCPALPVNGRQVRNGHLYVNGIPLHETHMRFHPLTPMKSSSIPELMSKQGKYKCVVLTKEELETQNATALKLFADSLNQKVYFVPDYNDEEDAINIAKLFHDAKFLTGGSGILTELCKHCSCAEQAASVAKNDEPRTSRALLLAGSCSAVTLKQIQCFAANGGNLVKINPQDLFACEAAPTEVLEQLWEKVQALNTPSILLYSSAEPEQVAAMQDKYGKEAVSSRLEQLMANMALKATHAGWQKIIVAGGETSGAVTEALEAPGYEIGAEIAPGVPIMYPLGKGGLQLALKSGNFGSENFFNEAIAMMNGDKQ